MSRSFPSDPVTCAASERGARRERNALRTTVSTVLVRAASALVSFVSLPLVVRYLGKERYGIWVTVATMAGWLAMLDLGLGSGMKNLVAAASGRDDDDRIRASISTGSILTLVPIGIAFAVLQILIVTVDWSLLFNAGAAADPEELRWVVLTTTTIVLLTMWTNIGYAIVHALQRGYLANYFAAGGAIVALGATVAAASAKASLPWLAVALLAPGAIAPAMLWGVIAAKDERLRPRFQIERAVASELMGSGIGFFLLQIAVVVVLQLDNFVIARVNGPAEVTPYAVAARVMALGTLLFGVYLSALWPAYREAAARGDWTWITKTHKRTRWIVTGGTALVGVAFIALGPVVIPLWAGPAASAGWHLYAWIAAAAVIRAWTDTHAVLLNGLNRLRPQIVSALVHAAVAVVLAFMFATRWGAVGVAASGLLAYAAISAWWLPVAVSLVVPKPGSALGSECGSVEKAPECSDPGATSSTQSEVRA